MKILFASNNVSDWGNSPLTNTSASAIDNTRVPYGIEAPNDHVIPMRDFHIASTGDFTWYHYRLKLGASWGSSQDGYFGSIYDSDGILLARMDVLNGACAAQVFGDSTVTGGFTGGWGSSTILEVDISVEVTTSIIEMKLYLGQALISTAQAANTSGLKTGARRFDFQVADSQANATEAIFSEFIVAESDTRGVRMTRLDVADTFGNYSAWAGDASYLSDDDAVSGLVSDTAAQRTSAAIATLSGSPTVGALVSMASATRGPTGPQDLKQSLRIASTDYDGDLHSLEESNTFYIQCWELDPSDSGAWTTAKINAVEAGLLSVA